MHTYIYFVDYSLSADFFFRLAKSDPASRHVVMTPLFSVFVSARLCKAVDKVFFVGKCSGVGVELPDSSSRWRELRLGMLSELDARGYYRAAQCAADKALCIKGAKTICLWNGDSILGAVAREQKQKSSDGSITTCFFEIANLPGKVFCDPQGVNQASFLFRAPEILNQFSYDEEEFKLWRDHYISYKLAGAAPPQVALSKKVSFSNLIDFLASKVFSYRLYTSQSIKTKISSFINGFIKPSKPKVHQEEPIGEYVFFPMQVSTDTQVVFNSDYNNLSALDYILKSTTKTVAVKPHPAEADLDYLRRYVDNHPERERILVTQENTYSLIINSISVFVINSTVGFEALLMGKNVKFLGRSFFSSMDVDAAGKYVMGYLLDIDFFRRGGFVAPNIMDECRRRGKSDA